MSWIADWVHLPLVKALGWALAHFLWEGVLIALLLAAVLAVCRGAKARYGAASVAMLAMLAAFGITLAVSIPDAQVLPPLPRSLATAAGPGGGFTMTAYSSGIMSRLQAVLPWVVPFWMAGAVLIAFYRLGGWIAAERMRRAGVCAAPPEWQTRLRDLAHRIGVSKPLVLLESSLAEVPVVIGLIRPAILVPAGLLAGLPPQHLEAILLHELAHIRRFDYLVNLVQTLVESLLFYHPAVWWVSGRMRAERENCCDDMVVALHGDAREYAAVLVTLEERRSVGREPALAATGGELMLRIRRLLNQSDEPRSATALLLSVGLLLGLFCLFAAAQQQSSSSSQVEERAASKLRAELETPYSKWLNEDVAYIITPKERVAFKRLRTDEEREHFVQQFWQRRDPTPGTPENEFKIEHYRRISYANQRFAATTPGWRTDRGRVYIMFGPPDEIESHPVQGAESWLYHHIEGIGNNVIVEFLDPAHTGEYRLANSPEFMQPPKK